MMCPRCQRGEPCADSDAIAELRRLSELKPEPVETVTSTTGMWECHCGYQNAAGSPCTKCGCLGGCGGYRDNWAVPELDSPAYHSEAAERLRMNGFNRVNRGSGR